MTENFQKSPIGGLYMYPGQNDKFLDRDFQPFLQSITKSITKMEGILICSAFFLGSYEIFSSEFQRLRQWPSICCFMWVASSGCHGRPRLSLAVPVNSSESRPNTFNCFWCCCCCWSYPFALSMSMTIVKLNRHRLWGCFSFWAPTKRPDRPLSGLEICQRAAFFVFSGCCCCCS